ncbi:MAG TPA: PAS domain S-box protein, partial [Gemmatimonadaceae bacterium]|nr:PAS domain S-box protein [Gemmatimonadaceae bacterium]
MERTERDSMDGGERRGTVWARWTEPSPEVRAAGDRRSARLLAGLMLCLMAIGITSATVQLVLATDFRVPYLAIVGAAALLGVGYHLARTVHFRSAALLACFIPIVAGAAVGVAEPADPAWYAFMCIGMVLAIAFLTVRQVAGIIAITVIVTVGVLVVATPPIAAPRTVAIVSFVGAMGGLVFLTGRHLHLVEEDRGEELRETAARYQQLFDLAPVGIGVATASGRIVEANETLLSIMGYSREALGGAPDVSTFYAELSARQRLLRRLEDDGRVVGEDVVLRRGDGSALDATVSLVPLTLRGERCTLAIIEDMGPRRRAEEDRAYLAQMLERSVNEVYIFDADTLRFEYANEGARHNLGYTMDALRGMTPVDLKPEFTPDSFRQLLAPLVRGDVTVLAFETQHRRADGTLYPVDARLQRATRRGHAVVQAMILDITDRRRLQAELLQSQKLESVGRLAGGVAHDFNNLLTVIRANVELASGEVGVSSAASDELSAALRAVDSASALTRQLLAFSRRQVIAPRVVDLNLVVADLERLVRRLLTEDIVLVTHRAPSLGLVRADPNQLEQVLVNLTVNARDAMPNGGRLTITTGNARGGDPDPTG